MLTPTDRTSWAMLADAFHELGRANFSYIPRAIASCEQSARLAPRNAQTWNNLAKVLGEAGRHDEAIGAARRAVEL